MEKGRKKRGKGVMGKDRKWKIWEKGKARAAKERKEQGSGQKDGKEEGK